MRYMMLIFGDDDALPAPGTPEQQELMSGYFAFGEEARAAGVMETGEPLEHKNTATTVRVRDGQTLTTDGPFIDTKEYVGGFYILDCENLDQAIEFAAKIPHAAISAIEVRPIMEMPGSAE